MATRIDNLVLLLDTGSKQEVRLAAANRIGEISKQRPEEFDSLLNRVSKFLSNKSWDTRIAAGWAIESLAKNLQFDVNVEPPGDIPNEKECFESCENYLCFDNFDIGQICTNDVSLLGSTGKEYDFGINQNNTKDMMSMQRRALKQRLGLSTHFMSGDIIGDSDLMTFPSNNNVKQNVSNKQQEFKIEQEQITVKKDEETPDPMLSAREWNRLKRKMRIAEREKQLASQRRNYYQNNSEDRNYNSDDSQKITVKFNRKEEDSSISTARSKPGHWPFESFCEKLLLNLFSPVWQIRHGAAVGLREIIKTQGMNSGMVIGLSKETNNKLHNMWLEDVAIHFLCVLAMDKFGDYGSDQTITPVRETTAQALGALMHWAEKSLCLRVANLGLLKLLNKSEQAIENDSIGTIDKDRSWQMRHSALVGLKYCLTARKDLLRDYICDGNNGQNSIFKAIVDGLVDSVDDVRSVSSSAILAIYEELIAIVPPEIIYSTIVVSLWKCLVELDDLTSATAFVMNLLSKLIMTKDISEIVKQNGGYSTKEHLSLLYAFLRHTILSVRIATLNTISKFPALISVDSSSDKGESWMSSELLTMVFQNFIMDDTEEVVNKSSSLWRILINCIKNLPEDEAFELINNTMKERLPSWVTLIVTPIGRPLDVSHIYFPKRKIKCNNQSSGNNAIVNTHQTFIAPHDDIMIKQDITIIPETHLIFTKAEASAALGLFLAFASGHWTDEYSEIIVNLFNKYLNSTCVNERIYIYVIIEEWAIAWSKNNKNTQIPNFVGEFLVKYGFYDLLMNGPESMSSNDPLFCSELYKSLSLLRADCGSLLSDIKKKLHVQVPKLPKIFQPSQVQPGTPVFSVHYAEHITSEMVPKIVNDINDKYSASGVPEEVNKHLAQIDASCKLMKASTNSYNETSEKHKIRWASLCAAALVTSSNSPQKIGVIVKALISAVKKEQNECFQEKACTSLAIVIERCANSGKSEQLLSKIIRNLCSLVGNDTPIKITDDILRQKEGVLSIDSVGSSAPMRDPTNDLLKTLDPEKQTKSSNFKKRKSNSGEYKALEKKPEDSGSSQMFDDTLLPNIASNGVISTFKKVFRSFKGELFEKIPSLLNLISVYFIDEKNNAFTQEQMYDQILKNQDDIQYVRGLAKTLYIISVIVEHLDPSLFPKIEEFLPCMTACVKAPLAVFRRMSSICVAAICSVSVSKVMEITMKEILPLLDNTGNDIYRKGSSECIYCIMKRMDHKILPYIIFFVIPMLRRMSDPVECIRFICSNVFAYLIELIPLESNSSDTEGLSNEIVGQKEEERKFLAQLIGLEKIDPVELGVKIEAVLRSYQVEGVNWLAFMHRYNLHGILCDDMGLGKTLQTICIMAASHYGNMKREINDKGETSSHNSLVLCPSTLTGHWLHELKNYAPYMKAIIYRGNLAERTALRLQFGGNDVIIMSYDIFRNDVDFLSNINFNYCVLDEGHIIKNPKTKITKAVKLIKAAHKVILTGTPIQNNYLDIWSLFDFLMPGFLGTYSQFNEKFSKPFVVTENSKKADSTNEKRMLAMETLHRQILPFLIRRLKEDMVEDLPPKIIQDYYCERSSLQKFLYECFNKSPTSTKAIDIISKKKGSSNDPKPDKESEKKRGFVLQALQYLRKLSNHPVLVLKKEHPEYGKCIKLLKEENMDLHDIRNAPKLVALKELLTDCGIGVKSEVQSLDEIERPAAFALHRALIFAQLNSMLDLIENDLFKKHMPGISYLRLDGEVNPKLRHDIVTQFNSDPSIDVLLLTTRVGGLGLTLTGADTVIFVEHDWSPMRDMQAMDRVHRIGQKKVVNVYRLITKDTLEEEIMGLQKFKQNLASSVINEENVGISTVASGQMLNIFSSSGFFDMHNSRKKHIEEDGNENNEDSYWNIHGGLDMDIDQEFIK